MIHNVMAVMTLNYEQCQTTLLFTWPGSRVTRWALALRKAGNRHVSGRTTLTWLNTLDSSYGIRVGYIHSASSGGKRCQRFLQRIKIIATTNGRSLKSSEYFCLANMWFSCLTEHGLQMQYVFLCLDWQSQDKQHILALPVKSVFQESLCTIAL